jgi:hypothetical protein
VIEPPSRPIKLERVQIACSVDDAQHVDTGALDRIDDQDLSITAD